MEIKHREILDRLYLATDEIKYAVKKIGPLKLSREEVLGYKFKVGEEVIDAESGETGTICWADRRNYVVQSQGGSRSGGVPGETP